MAQGREGRSSGTYFLAARLRSCFLFSSRLPTPKMQRTSDVPHLAQVPAHACTAAARLVRKAESAGLQGSRYEVPQTEAELGLPLRARSNVQEQ